MDRWCALLVAKVGRGRTLGGRRQVRYIHTGSETRVTMRIRRYDQGDLFCCRSHADSGERSEFWFRWGGNGHMGSARQGQKEEIGTVGTGYGARLRLKREGDIA